MESVDLGSITISANTNLRIEMQGDSVAYNNRIEHDFKYTSEQSVAVVSPILGCPREVVELETSGGLTYLWY